MATFKKSSAGDLVWAVRSEACSYALRASSGSSQKTLLLLVLHGSIQYGVSVIISHLRLCVLAVAL